MAALRGPEDLAGAPGALGVAEPWVDAGLEGGVLEEIGAGALGECGAGGGDGVEEGEEGEGPDERGGHVGCMC